jgi:hypothetical protein
MARQSDPRNAPRRFTPGHCKRARPRHGREPKEAAPGAFRTTAFAVLDSGLLPLPCGGKDGKRPLRRYTGRSVPTAASVAANVRNECLSGAGIGMLTGAGRHPVTVIDIDDAGLVHAVLLALGETPVVVRTPRGGAHLWYRHGGERSTTLRAAGLAIDIKGARGFVVIPPTAGASKGYRKAKAYRFEQGSLADVAALPSLPDNWRHRLRRLAPPARPPTTRMASATPAQVAAPTATLAVGQRNNGLFGAALRLAPHCDSADDLAAQLADANAQMCDAPLAAAEVRKIANSAWHYEARGQNWVRSDGVVQFPTSEIRELPCGSWRTFGSRMAAAANRSRSPRGRWP